MLLEVDEVVAGYGQIRVLHGLSLKVDSGERVGLFGPNGHGKTTLLRAISGLLRPRAGDIRFKGTSLISASPSDIVNLGLVHVPQGNRLFPRMTVLENLILGAYCKRTWQEREQNLARVYELFPVLAARRSQEARTLSGGERQMVAIGTGLMAKPDLLMLDEPTLGLAPKAKESLAAAIGAIGSTGVALLVVDQDVEVLLGLTSRLNLIESGRVAFETGSDVGIDEAKILEMYFGATPS